MGVPSFSDFSKSTNDLLGKDYPIGSAKLEVNSTTSNGIARLSLTSKQNTPQNPTESHLPKTGLLQTPSERNLKSKTKLQKVSSLTSLALFFLPMGAYSYSSTKNVKALVEYKQALLVAKTSVDVFAKAGPLVHADVVLGSDGIIVGADIGYTLNDAAVQRYNAAIGYNSNEYSVAIHATNKFTNFAALYHHKVSKTSEIGAKAVWNKATSDSVLIEVGGKLVLDANTFVKAKIDNVGRLGLGYSQTLRPGVKIGLGGSFDTARLNENVHKVGVSFTFDN